MKLGLNVGGAVLGMILAAAAIFGLVQQQGGITQPQTYSPQINYDQ